MSGYEAATAMAETLLLKLSRFAGAGRSAAAVLDRSDTLSLAPASAISPNGTCRLIAARDGWLAVNLPRADDIDLVPAWTGCGVDEPHWAAIDAAAQATAADEMVRSGVELGLAVARLDESASEVQAARLHRLAPACTARQRSELRVVDLSALWAGPLCASFLADAGHRVVKVQARTRPDPTARFAPLLDARLNGGKERLSIDFTPANLGTLLEDADILVTSARPRAFDTMGLTPEWFLSRRPGRVWVAITGHGWMGAGAGRIGFGDDAAIAGGLVDWHEGRPRFAGDALADPLAGLVAAAAAFEAVEAGGGLLVDVALSRAAARAARAA
nr:CoA transferase [Sphingomonas sp. CDS-1]